MSDNYINGYGGYIPDDMTGEPPAHLLRRHNIELPSQETKTEDTDNAIRIGAATDTTMNLDLAANIKEYVQPKYLDEKLPLLVANQTSALASESGQGKTSFILAMIERLQNIDWLYYTEEDKERIAAALKLIGANVNRIRVFDSTDFPKELKRDHRGKPDGTKVWAHLPQLREDQEAVFVFDTASNFAQNFFSDFDENKAKDVRGLFGFLKPLREKGYTILLVAHLSDKKDKNGKTPQTIFGSSAYKMECDRTFLLNRTQNVYNIFPVKRRGGQEKPLAAKTDKTYRLGIMEYFKGLELCAVEEAPDADYLAEEKLRKRITDAIVQLEIDAQKRFGATAWMTHSVEKIRKKCQMKAKTASETIALLVQERVINHANGGITIPTQSELRNQVNKNL